MMYILNIASAIKNMCVNETRDFIFENYYKRTGFSKKTVIQSNIRKKDLRFFATKLTKNIPDPRNANTINNL